MADLKDSRAQSRLEKAARETGGNAGLHYETEAKAVREKIARLRALRMAKETADKNAAVSENAKRTKSVAKRSVKSTVESAPPASLVDQPKAGCATSGSSD
jgi:hypothetical protein